MEKNRRLSVWLPVIIALSVALGIFVGNHYLRLTQGKRHIYSSGNKINAILDIIDEQYVDTVNMKQLVEDAIPKVFSELDPHSVYIPAKDAQRVNEDLEGSFSGIGVSFNMQTDTVLVINVIPGGPSEKAGLKPFDRIITINDSLYAGNKSDQAACFSFYDTKEGNAMFVAIVGQGPVTRGYPIIGMGKPGVTEGIPKNCTGFPLFDPRGKKADELCAKFCAEHTCDEIEEIFNKAGIPCQRAYGPADIEKDPQYEARENIVEWDDQCFGKMKGIGVTNIFKKNPSQIVASAPCFGEHNREVLKDFGYTDEEIDALYKKGELATWTPADTARIKNFVEWHFFWDPERQAKRIGLEYPPKK